MGHAEHSSGEATVNRVNRFADASDYAECRRLHRAYGATYYFATLRLPAHLRPRVHALYGFVRVPDEWVDNPGHLTLPERRNLLDAWRQELRNGLEGVRPKSPVMRAFCDVALDTSIPVEEPMAFLDSMEQDLDTCRYPRYEDLVQYMRGSAAAVGVMMCYVLGGPVDDETVVAARALGEAMQLTNFLRDVAEDAARGRIYLPEDDLIRFGVTEAELLEGKNTDRFGELMKFEIRRARALYSLADSGIERLPQSARRGVKLARVLYERILEHIERRHYDVFTDRVRTSRVEKLAAATQMFFSWP